MRVKFVLALSALVLAAPVTHAAENPAEVDAVVAAAKAANPAVCQSGPTGIKEAVTAQVKALAMAGKIQGNPAAVGAEAGQKLGRSCAGG